MLPRSRFAREAVNCIFTNRDHPISYCDRAHAELLPDQYCVLVYYGVVGQDKTALRRHLMQCLTAEQPCLHRFGALYWDQASGNREDRPGLSAFLKALRAGDVLVIWKLDWLGRDLRYLVNMAQEFAERYIGFKVLAGQSAEIEPAAEQTRQGAEQ